MNRQNCIRKTILLVSLIPALNSSLWAIDPAVMQQPQSLDHAAVSPINQPVFQTGPATSISQPSDHVATTHSDNQNNKSGLDFVAVEPTMKTALASPGFIQQKIEINPVTNQKIEVTVASFKGAFSGTNLTEKIMPLSEGVPAAKNPIVAYKMVQGADTASYSFALKPGTKVDGFMLSNQKVALLDKSGGIVPVSDYLKKF